MVFEHPLHGDHQQVLQLKLPVLDLQGAFLGVGGGAGGFRASLPGDTGPQHSHPPAWGRGQTRALNCGPGVWSSSGPAPRDPPQTRRVQRGGLHSRRAGGLLPLIASGVCSGHTGGILSDPWPGVYQRHWGRPAHTKGGDRPQQPGAPHWLPGHMRASGLSEGRVTPSTARAKGRGHQGSPWEPSEQPDTTWEAQPLGGRHGRGGRLPANVRHLGPHGVPIGQGQGSVTAPHSAGSGPGVLPQLHPGWALAWAGDLPLPTLNPNKMQRKKNHLQKTSRHCPVPSFP